MNNVRGLYPPLYGATPSGGGGGGGQHIQVDALPEASLQYKDKIVQYVGATTETLTNGYFYKCVEHTETEGGTITVTYSWDNVAVMSAPQSGIAISETETKIGTYGGSDLYAIIIPNAKINKISLGNSATELVPSANMPANISKLLDIWYYLDIGSYKMKPAGSIGILTSAGSLNWIGHTSISIAASQIQTQEIVLFYTKS